MASNNADLDKNRDTQLVKRDDRSGRDGRCFDSLGDIASGSRRLLTKWEIMNVLSFPAKTTMIVLFRTIPGSLTTFIGSKRDESYYHTWMD